MHPAGRVDAALDVALVAGESSGDLIGAAALQALRARRPSLQAAGIGGPALRALGFDAWWPSERLAVRGYVEVLRHLPALLWIRSRLAQRLLQRPPKVFVGVDAPDFNLGLEQRLKGAGIPTLHFVSPSIWAWRPQRIHRIAQAVDHMLCVFPFEPALYHAHGLAASYVGHPMADVIPLQPERAAARLELGLPADAPVVALLPGSRNDEITQLLDIFLAAAQAVGRRLRGARFVLPVAHAGLRARIDAAVARSDVAVHCVAGRSHRVLEACDVALVASGTATLETALYKRPMVVAYRMPALSWRLMKPKHLQPWVALPNILLGEFAVPELIQDDCTADRLAAAVLRWFDEPQRVAQLAERFMQLHVQLRCGCAERVAERIEAHVG